MRNFLTTYEAAKKLDVTQGYVRRLMQEKRIKGELAPVSKKRSVWLVDKASLSLYKASLKA
jgi:hypothetical protein